MRKIIMHVVALCSRCEKVSSYSSVSDTAVEVIQAGRTATKWISQGRKVRLLGQDDPLPEWCACTETAIIGVDHSKDGDCVVSGFFDTRSGKIYITEITLRKGESA